MSKRFGDHHAKAFRMGREHKKVCIEESRLLHLRFDRTCEGNDLAQAGRRYCPFDLLPMASFVGSGDTQAQPFGRTRAQASINIGRPLIGINPTEEKRRRLRPFELAFSDLPELIGGCSSGTSTPFGTVAIGTPSRGVAGFGFRLARCDMATRLFADRVVGTATRQVSFFNRLWRQRPRLEHAARTDHPGNAALFSQRRKSVVMR